VEKPSCRKTALNRGTQTENIISIIIIGGVGGGFMSLRRI